MNADGVAGGVRLTCLPKARFGSVVLCLVSDPLLRVTILLLNYILYRNVRGRGFVICSDDHVNWYQGRL